MLADQFVEKFVRDLANGVPALLLGTDDFQRDHNSTAFLLPNRREIGFYDKQHLVPFGEYLPFRPLLGWAIGGLVPGDFAPGTETVVYDLPNPALKLAPLICFEDTVGLLTRRPVQQGAHVLVNITNDGWFGLSAGAEQHFVNSIFRAVENRRPLLRCTNTGITASVDIFGQVDRWLKPFTMLLAQRTVAIPTRPPSTFYTRHGEVFSVGCVGLTVLAIGWRLALRRRQGTPRIEESPRG